MFQMNFVSDTRKAAQHERCNKEYVIIIRNKYIYEFERQYITLSAVQLHVGMLTMII